MGLYAIDCYICGKPFLWFSGNPYDQRCDECRQKGYATKEDFEKDNKNEVRKDTKETT